MSKNNNGSMQLQQATVSPKGGRRTTSWFQSIRGLVLLMVFGSLAVVTFFQMKFYKGLSWEELQNPTEFDVAVDVASSTKLAAQERPPKVLARIDKAGVHKNAAGEISTTTTETAEMSADDNTDNEERDDSRDEIPSARDRPPMLLAKIDKSGVVHRNNFSDTETDSIVDNPLPPSAQKRRKEPPTKIAYAFFLGGIPPPSNTSMTLQPALGRRGKGGPLTTPRYAYRGLLYNILVSVKILRDAGSKADFVLLVQMTEPDVVLPDQDVRLIRQMGIILKYCPPPYDAVNEISTIPVEKFRILDLVDYARVLYMDADITPRCNLDYLMELSIQGVLRDNVIVSIGDTPASSKIFVLTPGPGKLWNLAKLIPPHASSQGIRHGFRAERGWGDGPYAWRAIDQGSGKYLNFPGANNDQGLLFQHTKHSARSVSIIRGNVIEHWSPSPPIENSTMGSRYESTFYWWSQTTVARVNKPTNNTLKEFSCSRGLGDTTDHQNPWEISPPGVAPYQDIIQWGSRKGLDYPWNREMAPGIDATSSPNNDWFRVLRQLDGELQIGLGLHQSNVTVSTGKWKHVPSRTSSPFDPMWSEDAKALRQWANRLVDTSTVYLPWRPPVVQEVMDEDPTSLRTQCQCPKTMPTDLCSTSSNVTIEDWLSERVPYYLSKQRPLCPRAARHTIHVVLPFYNKPLETMQQSICSVACQHYPVAKVMIYAFDYGSKQNEATSIKDLNLDSGHNNVLEFKPAKIKLHGKFGGVSNENELNDHAKEKFLHYMSTYQTAKAGPSLVRVRFRTPIDPGGSIFWALRMVQNYAGPNDIMMVLEGQLVMTNALETINEKFVSEGAILTYGSYDDKNADPSSDIDRDFFESNKFQPRKKKPKWCFGGPWSFKTHLLQDVSIQDFTHKSGEWLIEPANRGYFLRMLDRAKMDRLGFISQPIARRYEPLPSRESHAHFKQIMSLESSSRWNSPTTMIMLQPRSADLLSRQLEWLQGQTIAQKRMIKLHLLKENTDDSTWVDDTVESFKQTQKARFNGYQTMRVTVASTEGQLNTFARFHYVRTLRSQEKLDTVIFLDNDQYWSSSFIEILKKKHQPKTITAWYGKTFTRHHEKTGVAELTNSKLTEKHLAAGTFSKGEKEISFTVSQLGGVIFDSNLWLMDHLFQFEENFRDYADADAVWVAFVMDALLGWDQRRLFASMPPLVSLSRCERDLEYKARFCSRLPQDVEHFLPAETADVGSSEPPESAVEALESDFFAKLQTELHWNVIRPHSLPPLISDDELSGGPREAGNGDEKRKRAFVCITGQLERVELENKIRNVFQPLQKIGWKIDLALALSAGEARFTNTNTKKSNFPFYTSFEQAVSDLTKHKINVVTRDGPHKPWANPSVSKDYVNILHGGQKHHRSYEDQIVRAKNHMRIFDSYHKCLEHADAAAAKASSTLEAYYDAIIRIREDIGFKAPLDGTKSKRKALFDVTFPPPQGSIIVTKCRSWLGMNDRFAIVAPDIARAYFQRPLDIMRQGKVYDPHAVRNPESLLLYIYSLVKFKVLGHQDLHGLRRMYKKANGEAVFNKDDTSSFERCPKPEPYRERFRQLYGWAL
ncbi:expressed unknown protein [Seminavis robusta]|uniref:Uncharacterized protein n=1 Tax=Seminavis robusta TaxID=568900 RepID=A0A9N8HUY2_9STRA|nr:expressed unknown protein [Seminavis robusta]|eukprot:Sro1899_g304190.1 n/a (1588) ;mRNA; f:8283-13245